MGGMKPMNAYILVSGVGDPDERGDAYKSPDIQHEAI
jgi:hypothetical protein